MALTFRRQGEFLTGVWFSSRKEMARDWTGCFSGDNKSRRGPGMDIAGPDQIGDPLSHYCADISPKCFDHCTKTPRTRDLACCHSRIDHFPGNDHIPEEIEFAKPASGLSGKVLVDSALGRGACGSIQHDGGCVFDELPALVRLDSRKCGYSRDKRLEEERRVHAAPRWPASGVLFVLLSWHTTSRRVGISGMTGLFVWVRPLSSPSSMLVPCRLARTQTHWTAPIWMAPLGSLPGLRTTRECMAESITCERRYWDS